MRETMGDGDSAAFPRCPHDPAPTESAGRTHRLMTDDLPPTPIDPPSDTWTRAVVRNAAFLVVVALVLVALSLIVADRWRRGVFIVGGAAVVGGVARMIVAEDYLGLLVVRSRRADAAFLLVTGVAILVLTLTVDTLA